jgi:hypothetical protein
MASFYTTIHADGGINHHLEEIKSAITKANDDGCPLALIQLRIPAEFADAMVPRITNRMILELGIPREQFMWNGPTVMVTWGALTIDQLQTMAGNQDKNLDDRA